MSETIDWQKFEELIKKNGIFIDRPKGTSHPRYSNRIYPVDYGYIKNTVGADGEEIDVFVGKGSKGVVGIVRTVDSVKHDAEIKILWNMDLEEAKMVESFLNFGGMKATLIWRN